MAESEPVECLPVIELSRSEARFWQRLARYGQRGVTYEIDGCVYRFLSFHAEGPFIEAERLCGCVGNPMILWPLREHAHDAKSPLAYVGEFRPWVEHPCQHGSTKCYLSHAVVSRAMGRLLSGHSNIWKDYDQPKKKRTHEVAKTKPVSKKWKQTELAAK